MKVFTIKSYGFGELSSLFSPDINMASASKQLKRWITGNPKLLHLLQQEGWEKGHKRLTPKMVQHIVSVLGEPWKNQGFHSVLNKLICTSK